MAARRFQMEEYNGYLLKQFETQSDSFEGCSSPLFMHPFDEYFDSKLKVLIVGQETNGWGKLEKKHSVQVLQNWYKKFKLG